MLTEHFAGRPEYVILQKLMTASMAGDAQTQALEFHAALQRMQDQAVAQRRATLTSKGRSGVLDAAEKAEMRQLLAARVPPTTST
jgi:DNA primase